MFAITLFVLALSICSLAEGSSILPTDVSLLYLNDLNVSTLASTQSILVLGEHSKSSAQQACESLHETLLSKESPVFKNDIKNLLQSQVQSGKFNNLQLFWIAPEGTICQAVNPEGSVISTLCGLVLPSLCTQSAGAGATASSSNTLTLQSNSLTVTGFRDLRSFRFLGIPYANAPARWTYPSAYTGPTTLNATQFGSACIQTGTTGTSEDCLFLNIFSPFVPGSAKPSKSSLKAVMFWIHGGAFTGGTGADPTFDGGNMASRGDVVMVTINYRLSTLGFLALDDGKTNGNFGIADIITALEWVNEHISSFGGDPDRITIFGQSAGAAAVRTLLGSPKAIGKYAGAIQMSNLAGLGYATTYSLYDTIPQEVATVAEPIMQSVNCTEGDVLACLKAVDGNTLVNLPTVARFVVVDGTFVTHDELILDGTAPVANVHHMMGFMRDDGAAFISNPTTSNLMLAVEEAGLPGSIATSPLFPMPNISTNALDNVFNVTARGATDGLFRCLDQATAVSAIQHNLFKSMWFYEFNRSYQTPGFDPNAPRCDAPVDATHPNGDPDKEYYKCHSGELFYVFGNLPSDLPLRDDKDLPFMQMQLDTWTSFARTFNPNPEPAFLDVRGYTASAKQLSAQEEWVAVSKSNINTKPLRQLEWPSFMTEFKEQSQCSFLNFSLNSFG